MSWGTQIMRKLEWYKWTFLQNCSNATSEEAGGCVYKKFTRSNTYEYHPSGVRWFITLSFNHQEWINASKPSLRSITDLCIGKKYTTGALFMTLSLVIPLNKPSISHSIIRLPEIWMTCNIKSPTIWIFRNRRIKSNRSLDDDYPR